MGLFLDYGLNDISKDNSKDVIVYNAYWRAPTKRRQAYIFDVKTLAFGLKVRYAFQM